MHHDRFDRFSTSARLTLTLAQEEAQRFNHNYVGTEHLLLGIVRQEGGTVAEVLESLGIELHKLRNAVEFIIGRGDRPAMGEIGLTPRAKKVIELAVDEARRLGHHYIGTEHLLLGLVREGEGIAAGVLESLGVSLGKVRRKTLAVLESAAPGKPGGPALRELRRVVPVAQSQERDGIRVALEDYAEGFVVALRVVSPTELSAPSAAAPGHLVLSIADDRDRRYTARGWRSDETGTTGDWRAAVPCWPAIEPTCRELRLEAREREGTRVWSFVIPLASE